MASTKLYLDMRGKAADGKGSVLIQVFHNRTMTSISTGIRLSPSEWDGTKVVRSQSAEILNATLQERKGKIDKDIALMSLNPDFTRMTASDIKRSVKPDRADAEAPSSVSGLFNDYIENSSLSEGTRAIYKATLRKVESFGGESLGIGSVNLKWLRAFDKYLSKTQGVNGRSIYMRSLRAVCNYARHIGIDFQYPFSNFQIRQEATRKRSVSVESLREFRDYPTSDRNSMFRDYFFLMFYLIGVNTVDLLLAKKDQIVDGRFEYIRRKTGKRYSVKVEPEAMEIIGRRSGKDWLLDAMDSREGYRSFAHDMNDSLKLIGDTVRETIPVSDSLFDEPEVVERVMPVIPGITTYSARHTWATLAHETGVPMDVISQALGHSFGNRTTLIYIKPDIRKVDEANRRVIDYLNG